MQLSSLRIIGEGPIALDHSLKNVEWLGWLSPEAVMAGIRQARALVFPSIWYETFGLTAVEAMAHGVPVVVSDCTATACYIEDGVTGLHFRRGDATQLRQQLKYLSQGPEASIRMGQNAFDWFKQSNLDLKTHCQSLTDYYSTLIRT